MNAVGPLGAFVQPHGFDRALHVLDAVVGPDPLLLAPIDRHHELLRPQVELRADLVHDAQHLAVAAACVEIGISMCRWKTSASVSTSRLSASVKTRTSRRLGRRRPPRRSPDVAPRASPGDPPARDRRARDEPSPRPPRTPGRTRSAGPAPPPPAGMSVRTAAPSGTADCPGTQGEAALVDRARDRVDRQSPSIGCPNEPHAVHVRSGERPVVAGVQDPQLDEPGYVGLVDACLLSKLLQIAAVIAAG